MRVYRHGDHDLILCRDPVRLQDRILGHVDSDSSRRVTVRTDLSKFEGGDLSEIARRTSLELLDRCEFVTGGIARRLFMKGTCELLASLGFMVPVWLYYTSSQDAIGVASEWCRANDFAGVHLVPRRAARLQSGKSKGQDTMGLLEVAAQMQAAAVRSEPFRSLLARWDGEPELCASCLPGYDPETLEVIWSVVRHLREAIDSSVPATSATSKDWRQYLHPKAQLALDE